MNTKDVARFWSHVIKKRGCWGWKLGCTKFGYGIFMAKKKFWTIHRLSWILENGPIPEGKLVCHKCDNPICSNPAHLFIGDRNDNVQDCCKKGRHSKGEDRHTAKLSEIEVRSIRTQYRKGVRGFGFRQFARKYGVRTSTIMRLLQRKSWKHI